MRDVNWGWLLRYSHAVGASMFFLAAYIHTFRGLYYGSYKAPREVLWILGVLILLLMIATAFMGYSLPWGQMSFWAVTVITNLFSSLDAVIPGLGTKLVEWIWGGFAVGGPTLNRLYSLHYLFPFIIAGVVMLHIWALHIPGNNNPTGIDVKSPARDGAVPSLLHDQGRLRARAVHAAVRRLRVLRAELPRPRRQLHSGQSAADAAAYRAGMVFPAVLRDSARRSRTSCSASSRCSASIGILFFVPWLDTSKVRSTSYRPIYKWFFWAFVVTCVALGYLGSQPPEGWYLVLRAHLHRLLFRLLPGGDAGGRLDRAAAQTAGQHHRSRCSGRSTPACAKRAPNASARRWHDAARPLPSQARLALVPAARSLCRACGGARR